MINHIKKIKNYYLCIEKTCHCGLAPQSLNQQQIYSLWSRKSTFSRNDIKQQTNKNRN